MLQPEPNRGDVLTEIARADQMTGFAQLVKQFGADQVDLPAIGLLLKRQSPR